MAFLPRVGEYLGKCEAFYISLKALLRAQVLGAAGQCSRCCQGEGGGGMAQWNHLGPKCGVASGIQAMGTSRPPHPRCAYHNECFFFLLFNPHRYSKSNFPHQVKTFDQVGPPVTLDLIGHFGHRYPDWCLIAFGIDGVGWNPCWKILVNPH